MQLGLVIMLNHELLIPNDNVESSITNHDKKFLQAWYERLQFFSMSEETKFRRKKSTAKPENKECKEITATPRVNPWAADWCNLHNFLENIITYQNKAKYLFPSNKENHKIWESS